MIPGLRRALRATRSELQTLNATDGLFRGRPVDAKIGDDTPNTIVHLPLTSRIRGRRLGIMNGGVGENKQCASVHRRQPKRVASLHQQAGLNWLGVGIDATQWVTDASHPETNRYGL